MAIGNVQAQVSANIANMPAETCVDLVLSDMGKLEIPLRKESYDIYRLLQSLPNSSIVHLQKQDHLGELRSILKCGHHSRYDYIGMQLYIANFLKTAGGFGLSSPVKLTSRREISSVEELVKSWIFLDECGRLKGTYEAERFLFYIIIYKSKFTNSFREAIKDNQIISVADKIFDEQDLAKFHRLISWIFIKRCEDHKKYRSLENYDLATELIRDLLIDHKEESKLYKAKLYFSRIRRLANLYLDLINLPSTIVFKPATLFQTLSDSPEMLLASDSSTFNTFLSSIIDALQDRLYASTNANMYKLQRFNGLRSRLLEEVKDDPDDKFCKDGHTIREWIIPMRAQEIWGYRSPKEKIRHAHRLKLISDGYFEPSNVKIFYLEEKFENTTGTNKWVPFVTSYNTGVGSSCFLDVYENVESNKYNEGKLAIAMMDFIFHCYGASKYPRGLKEWICRESLISMFEFLLRRFFPAKVSFRFPEETRFGEHAIEILDSKPMRANWSRVLSWKTKKSKLSKERRWECDVLRREVRSAQQGRILCLTTSAIAEDNNHKSIAEFDGLFIRIHGSNLTLTITEAKTSSSGAATKSIRSMKEKLIKLNILDRKILSRVKIGDKSATVILNPYRSCF